MNVVDSSAWIEFITDSGNAPFFEEPIVELDQLIVPTITILEVFKFVSRRMDTSSALQAVAAMRQGTLVDLDAEIALVAARVGNEYGLPLADSVIYATAQQNGAVVWTQDSDFRNLPEVRFVEKSS